MKKSTTTGLSLKNSMRHAGALIFALCLTSVLASAQTLSTLYGFAGAPDGINAQGNLLVDSSGNFFGVTSGGGAFDNGTVFELSPASGGGWTETVLYNFTGGTDGAGPNGRLIQDAAGNLYGTAQWGGNQSKGAVFQLVRPSTTGDPWTENTIYGFPNVADGQNPVGGFVMDAAGNLFGEAYQGGSCNRGTIFELSPVSGGQWNYSVLHTFCTTRDGGAPTGGLLLGQHGALTGVTYVGGANKNGSVFRLRPPASGQTQWRYVRLHDFASGSDGANPSSALVTDSVGNLYGTTVSGGSNSTCSFPNACGVVFELSPPTVAGGTWVEKILWSFGGGADGWLPQAPVVRDAAGNLYGTTSAGGNQGCNQSEGCGLIFKLISSSGGWTKTTLHTFSGTSPDEGFPLSGLVLHAGALYGATAGYGSGQFGTVYVLKP